METYRLIHVELSNKLLELLLANNIYLGAYFGSSTKCRRAC